MAYLIITAGGEEIDRAELDGQVVIGRSPDCQVAIRDVLLSRHHCRIERHLGSWRVVDLNSRNGTRVNWNRVSSHRLRDGDVLRVGRTFITFRSGPFVPSETPAANRHRLVRPADPFEALAGTVAGFVLDDADREEAGIPQSPSVRPASPMEESLARSDDEPEWAVDLPDESTRPATAPRRTASGHWAAPTPQPRLEPAPAAHRMTDLSLQVMPELDLPPVHLSRLARMSDTTLFMSIFVVVSAVVTAGIITGMFLMTR